MAALVQGCHVYSPSLSMPSRTCVGEDGSSAEGTRRDLHLTSSIVGKSLSINSGRSQTRTGIRRSCKEAGIALCQSSNAPPEDIESSKPRRSSRGLKPVTQHSRRSLLSGITGLAAAACCPLCGPTGGSVANAADWAYGALSGPPSWGGLCSGGKSQSPINVPLLLEAVGSSPLGAMSFSYEPTRPTFFNTGHGTMQVNFPQGTNFVKVSGRTLELLQFHFHAPSEHAFNGTRTAMEVHLVHREAQTGKLAVVGVMMEGVPTAPPNPCLEAAIAYSPEEHGEQRAAPFECYIQSNPPGRTCYQIQISALDLLPRPDRQNGERSYIHYNGSLTTPPCTEGVDWVLMASSIRVPNSQVVEFMRYVGDRQTLALNSRPVQELAGRTLYLGP